MPLYAIRSTERLPYVIEETTIYYRRLTMVEWQQLHLRHTANGVIDGYALTREIVTTCIVGWEDYRDPVTDEAMPFEQLSPEEREREIVALPPNVQSMIGFLAQQTTVQRDTAQKNFSAGSNAPIP